MGALQAPALPLGHATMHEVQSMRKVSKEVKQLYLKYVLTWNLCKKVSILDYETSVL